MKSHEKEFLVIMLIVVAIGMFTSYLAFLGASGLFMSVLVGFAIANIVQKARGKPLPSFMPVGLRKGSRPYIVGVLILLITSGILGVGILQYSPVQMPTTSQKGGPVEGAFRLDVNQKNTTLTKGQSGDFGGSCTYNLFVLDGSDWVFVSSSGAKTASFTGSSNGWSLTSMETGSGNEGNYALFFESTAGYPMLDEMISSNGHLVNTNLGDGGKIIDDPDDDGNVERGLWIQFRESGVSPDEAEVFLFTARWLGEDASAAEGGNPADNTNVNCVSADVTRTVTWRIDISNEHEGIIIKDMYVKINETDDSLVYVDKSDADKAENWLDRSSFTIESFSDHMRYYIVKDLTPEDQCILSRANGESGAIYITVTFQYLTGGTDGDDVSLRLYVVWFNDAYGKGTSSTYDEVEDTI